MGNDHIGIYFSLIVGLSITASMYSSDRLFNASIMKSNVPIEASMSGE